MKIIKISSLDCGGFFPAKKDKSHSGKLDTQMFPECPGWPSYQRKRKKGKPKKPAKACCEHLTRAASKRLSPSEYKAKAKEIAERLYPEIQSLVDQSGLTPDILRGMNDIADLFCSELGNCPDGIEGLEGYVDKLYDDTWIANWWMVEDKHGNTDEAEEDIRRGYIDEAISDLLNERGLIGEKVKKPEPPPSESPEERAMKTMPSEPLNFSYDDLFASNSGVRKKAESTGGTNFVEGFFEFDVDGEMREFQYSGVLAIDPSTPMSDDIAQVIVELPVGSKPLPDGWMNANRRRLKAFAAGVARQECDLQHSVFLDRQRRLKDEEKAKRELRKQRKQQDQEKAERSFDSAIQSAMGTMRDDLGHISTDDIFSSGESWYKRASKSKKPVKCPACGHAVLKAHKSGQEGVYECLECGRAIGNPQTPYEGSWAHEEAIRRQDGKVAGPMGSNVFSNEKTASNEKIASDAGTPSQSISYEEGKALGLSRQDADHYNAFQDLANMIREHKTLTPEQRMDVWKKAVDEDIARLGYFMMPRLFGDNDYAIALRNGTGGGYEAFYRDFKAYGSEKPDVPKAKLDRTIANFSNLDEASQWIGQEFVKMDERRGPQEQPSDQDDVQPLT